MQTGTVMDAFYLGCPLWSHKDWVGELYTRDARPADYLRQYASAFDTVEGNTTFYALPKESTVQKWCDETPASFRFCFKFPQTISHNLRLQNAGRETDAFFERLAPLGQKLGPFFLQLPPTFGGESFFALVTYLNGLPKTFRYALEVRHQDFFAGDHWEKTLDDLLTDLKIDRVVFDTRGLHRYKAQTEEYHIHDAQRRKPKVPVRVKALGQHPFVRFIGHPVIEQNEKAFILWAKMLASWLADGKKPYFFMHAADNSYAPQLARYFHQVISKVLQNVEPIALWPAEQKKPDAATQLSLF